MATKSKSKKTPENAPTETESAESMKEVNQAMDALAVAKAKVEEAKAKAAAMAAAAKEAREAVREAKRLEREASGRKSWTRKLPDGADSTLVANVTIPKLHGFTKELLARFVSEHPETTLDDLIQQGMSRCAALSRARAKAAAKKSE